MCTQQSVSAARCLSTQQACAPLPKTKAAHRVELGCGLSSSVCSEGAPLKEPTVLSTLMSCRLVLMMLCSRRARNGAGATSLVKSR